MLTQTQFLDSEDDLRRFKVDTRIGYKANASHVVQGLTFINTWTCKVLKQQMQRKGSWGRARVFSIFHNLCSERLMHPKAPSVACFLSQKALWDEQSRLPHPPSPALAFSSYTWPLFTLVFLRPLSLQLRHHCLVSIPMNSETCKWWHHSYSLAHVPAVSFLCHD